MSDGEGVQTQVWLTTEPTMLMTSQRWQHGNYLVCIGHLLLARSPSLPLSCLEFVFPALPPRHWPAQASAGPDWVCSSVTRMEES